METNSPFGDNKIYYTVHTHYSIKRTNKLTDNTVKGFMLMKTDDF